jgi:tetratricopeptide (TPR) repeat protein
MDTGKSKTLVYLLKETLPETDWSWVLPALWQDKNVWRTLQNPEIGELAAREIGANSKAWTPAILGFLTLELAGTKPVDLVENLRLDLQYPLEIGLKKQAATVLEKKLQLRSTTAPDEIDNFVLGDAALAALALRERRRILGHWNGIGKEIISPGSGDNPAPFSQIIGWATPLACLMGIAPDPSTLLVSLIEDGSDPGFCHLALHAFLSNPLPESEQVSLISSVMSNLSEEATSSLLVHLQQQRAMLAEQAARTAAEAASKAGHWNEEPEGYFEQVKYLTNLFQQAETNRIAGEPQKASGIFKDAWKASNRLLAALSAQIADAAEEDKSEKDALFNWEEAATISPHGGDSLYYSARLANLLLDYGRLEDARAWLPEENILEAGASFPIYALLTTSLGQVRLASLDGNSEDARRLASRLVDKLEKDESGHFNQNLYALLRLPRILLDLGLIQESAKAARRALSYKPLDIELLKLTAEAEHYAGRNEEAARSLEAAAALHPQGMDLRRQYAYYLEESGDWETALLERTAVFENTTSCSQSLGDLIALAKCALFAGKALKTIEACIQAMDLCDDDVSLSEVHTIMGEALASLGKMQEAQEEYKKATELTPHLAAPWVALARLQKEEGQVQLALETLRACTQAAPDSPEAHLIMGEAYLDDWEGREHPALSQALEAFHQAYELIESTGIYDTLRSRIALKYGDTLHRLGHLKEARKVLEPAFQARPSYPGIPSILASVLMALHDPSAAIPALEYALKTEDDNPSLYLDFAKALLAVKERPGEAISAARRVLELAPMMIEAHALLAEALFSRGEFNEALAAYQSALETNLVENPDWSTRLSVGLGNVALALEQPDIAIATLREAANAAPQDPMIVRILSEAYQAAGLIEEGIQAARSALRLALDDLDTLIWFTSQALKWISENIIPEGETTNRKDLPWSVSLQVQVEALNALNHAIQIAPDRTDLRVRLGLLQLKAGEKTNSLETLRSVAFDDHAQVQDLQQAARYLLELDDADTAVSCLERAILIHQNKTSSLGEAGKSLLKDLVLSYYKAGNIIAALETLEKALTFSPEDVSLYHTKADLLLSQGRLQNAMESLNSALELSPENKESIKLRRKAALALRSAGKLPEALEQVEKILETCSHSASDPSWLSARLMAAELSRAMLQFQRARAYLGPVPSPTLAASDPLDEYGASYRSLCLSYFSLDAELGIELGEDVEVLEQYNQAEQLRASSSDQDFEPSRVRMLVLDARLKARHENQGAGIQLLQKIVGEEKWSLPDTNLPLSGNHGIDENGGKYLDGEAPNLLAGKMISVAEAALEFGEWDTALYLLRQSADLTPSEPLPFYMLARALTLRAEAQRLCQALDVIQHSPGPSAIAEHARQSFEQAVDTVEKQIEGWNRQNSPSWARGSSSAASLLSRWRARGIAAFRPGAANAQMLASASAGPSDVAAQIAALRNSWYEKEPPQNLNQEEELSVSAKNLSIPANAIQAARSYPNNPLVLSQLALTLSLHPADQQDALRAAKQAVRNSNGTAKAFTNTPLPLRPSQTAISNALLASLAFKSGDHKLARTAIQTALEIWPNESRWHSLASSINLAFGDRHSAIAHLEHAVTLEPKFIPHYLALGNAYLDNSNVSVDDAAKGDPMTNRAIQTLEQAARLAPEQPEPWLALGKAYLMAHDIDKAAVSADRAVELSPEEIQPLFLGAEIALRGGKFKEAYSYLENAFLLGDGDPCFTSEPSIILLQARVLDGLDRTSEALASLDKCLNNVPDPLSLQIERVHLIGRLQGEKAGLDAMVELGERYPDEPQVLTTLALKLAEANQTEAALRNAQKALQQLNSQPDGAFEIDVLEKSRLHNLVGRLMREMGHLDQAVHHLTEAIQHNPGLIDAYLELGLAHQERRQQTLALQVYNQASRIEPEDPRPYYQAGLALKESKDYLGAESMLRRSAELAPNDLTIHRQLGAIVALNLVHNRKRRSLE